MFDGRAGIREVENLKKQGYSLDMLSVLICEALDKHMTRNEKLTNIEKFYAGLRYSEFLALSDTDEGYYQAEVKRSEFLKVLGIDQDLLNKKVQEIGGFR